MDYRPLRSQLIFCTCLLCLVCAVAVANAFISGKMFPAYIAVIDVLLSAYFIAYGWISYHKIKLEVRMGSIAVFIILLALVTAIFSCIIAYATDSGLPVIVGTVLMVAVEIDLLTTANRMAESYTKQETETIPIKSIAIDNRVFGLGRRVDTYPTNYYLREYPDGAEVESVGAGGDHYYAANYQEVFLCEDAVDNESAYIEKRKTIKGVGMPPFWQMLYGKPRTKCDTIIIHVPRGTMFYEYKFY